MQELVDLTKILQKGDLVYDVIDQKTVKVSAINPDEELCIKTVSPSTYKKARFYTKHGSPVTISKDCFLFPSKETLTWEGYERPLKSKKYDIVLVSNDEKTGYVLGIFSHKSEDGLFHIFHEVDIENPEIEITTKGYAFLQEVPIERKKFFYKTVGNKPNAKNVVAKAERLE